MGDYRTLIETSGDSKHWEDYRCDLFAVYDRWLECGDAPALGEGLAGLTMVGNSFCEGKELAVFEFGDFDGELRRRKKPAVLRTRR